MWSVDLCVLICEKKKKKTKTERSRSGDPLPPETKLATEAQSSIYLPYRWSGDGSFFPGSKLTPLAQWSRITLGHHIHTHTPLSTIQTITQTQCNQCKHTLCSEEVPIQAQQWGTCLWFVVEPFKENSVWESSDGKTPICETGHLLRDRLPVCRHFLTLSESELMHFLSLLVKHRGEERTERGAAPVHTAAHKHTFCQLERNYRALSRSER